MTTYDRLDQSQEPVPVRRLTLRKETLRDLSAIQLRQVVGGTTGRCGSNI